MCVATPKNPWVEHTSFQAGLKQDNPSAHPILPRSMLVHLYPKETRRMSLQNLVSFSMNQLQQPVNFHQSLLNPLILQIQCLWCST